MNSRLSLGLNSRVVPVGRRPLLARTRLWSESIAAPRLLTGAGLFVVFATFLGLVQFATPNLVGNDGYYHIKLAYLMRTEGLKPSFDWLPLTVLNADEFVDHHFLYHVLLIPFTLGDLAIGAKLASVLFPSIGFLSFWWLLRSQRVPFAALWSLGLLVVSEAFIYRMSMPRVQTLSLAVLILALHWLMTGRQRWLLPLAFLYVWLYDAFPLILPLAGAYVAAGWLLERRLRWQPLAYAALGIALGLLVNPYFPENLVFLHRHILPKLVDSTAISVGSEWYPYRTTQLIENSGLALAAFLAGVLGLGLQKRRMGARTATLFLLSVLFGFMLFKSRRFIEYWPPFALLFSAFAWAPILRIWIGEKNSADEPTNANPSGSGPAREGSSWRRRILAGSLIAALLPALWFNLQTSRESVLRSKPIGRYAQASAWLKDHSPPGSRVFQTDWDDFPRLFFFNSHNTYTLGLDPTYMQLHDSELYLLWVDISGGRVELPSQEIRRTFGAEYVLTDLKHRSFLEAAERDPNLAEVYRDEHAAVFQVLLPDWGSMERSS